MNVKSKYTKLTNNVSEKGIGKKMIIIKAPLIKPNTYPKINRYGNDILNSDFSKIYADNIELLVICIYRINTIKNNYSTSHPYLEYLLYKYPSTVEKQSLKNTCIFPFVKCDKNKSIHSQANKLCHKITNAKINSNGFLEKNNNIYVFYEISDDQYKNINIEYIDSKTELWWTLIDEICNHQKILTFPIHKSVFELFYKNPQLIFLRDSNKKKIDIPIVGYIGGYENLLPTIVLSIDTEYSCHDILGSFNHAVREGGWSRDFKDEMIDDTKITGKNGKYKKGGIVRFAVFTQKSDSLINIKNNLSEFKKKLNNWESNYDSLLIGTIKTNDAYFNVNPYFNIKSFSQKTPLSVHLLDMKTLKKWDPFSKVYKIE